MIEGKAIRPDRTFPDERTTLPAYSGIHLLGDDLSLIPFRRSLMLFCSKIRPDHILYIDRDKYLLGYCSWQLIQGLQNLTASDESLEPAQRVVLLDHTCLVPGTTLPNHSGSPLCVDNLVPVCSDEHRAHVGRETPLLCNHLAV